ncbi:hypothetical protein [Streptomyces boncukensis]|uniref:Uncharacterized protein n=1 Tax=Streptomyces boncukensis TaxID=2711219 RepID=A0A6G4WPS5_9ACTN|nr:hypothetical protein [Streptomyces boncukensis]NGO67013.1 hypothetical protein [Streptomyces boncukensis]
MAWRAQFDVATRAPFLSSTHTADPDSRVGEAVYDSEAVTEALRELANGINPNRRFVPMLIEAAAAVTRLAEMRSSWIDYCNECSGLDPAATDAHSEMSRQYVSGNAVRAWPGFAAAQAALEPAAQALRKLQPELADFCGSDITAGRGAT